MADLGNIARMIPFPLPYTMYPNMALGNTRVGPSLSSLVTATITGGTPNMPVSLSINGTDISMILKLNASGSLNIYELNEGTWILNELGTSTLPVKNSWKIVVSGTTATVTKSSTSIPTSFSYT